MANSFCIRLEGPSGDLPTVFIISVLSHFPGRGQSTQQVVPA